MGCHSAIFFSLFISGRVQTSSIFSSSQKKQKKQRNICQRTITRYETLLLLLLLLLWSMLNSRARIRHHNDHAGLWWLFTIGDGDGDKCTFHWYCTRHSKNSWNERRARQRERRPVWVLSVHRDIAMCFRRQFLIILFFCAHFVACFVCCLAFASCGFIKDRETGNDNKKNGKKKKIV